MQYAVINVKPGSAYAGYNGRFFPVVEQIGKRVTVKIGSFNTDFISTEVIVFNPNFVCSLSDGTKAFLESLEPSSAGRLIDALIANARFDNDLSSTEKVNAFIKRTIG